jgi:excisionase family DNA binding protein
MDTDNHAITLADLAGRLFATVPEAAAILRYDPRTLRRAIADGEIPAVKAGATYRIPVAWLRAQALAGSDGAAA